MSKNPIQPTKWWQLIWYTIINQPPKKHEFNWWQTVEMHGLTIECAHTHKKFRELPNKHGRTSRASSLMHAFISMLPRTHTQTKDMVLSDFRPSLAGFCRERRRSLTMAAAASPPQSSRDNLAPLSLSRGNVVCQYN